MKRFGFLMILAALAFPLTACTAGESETDGDGESTEESTGEAGAAQASGEEAAEKICCGGGCDAPAGYCCNDDGTCGGSHEKLPVAP